MPRDNLSEDIRWLEQEESAAYAIDIIKGTLNRFRQGGCALKESRVLLKKKFDGIIKDMETAKKSLKETGDKINELNAEIKQVSSGYIHIKARESSTKERYNKLLSGSVPAEGNFVPAEEGLVSDEELEKRKEEFLRSLTGAFAKLDGELKQLRATEDAIRHKKDSLGRTVKTLKLGRAIYSRKIDKLRADIACIRGELRDNKENEDVLLREFFNFTERLKLTSGATEATERTLLVTDAALKSTENSDITSSTTS